MIPDPSSVTVLTDPFMPTIVMGRRETCFERMATFNHCLQGQMSSTPHQELLVVPLLLPLLETSMQNLPNMLLVGACQTLTA